MYFRDVVLCSAFFKGKDFVRRSQALFRPVFCIETHRHLRGSAIRWPFHDRAFDQAGVNHHQGLGAIGIFDGGLSACIELAPSGAFAIDQIFPSDNVYPMDH